MKGTANTLNSVGIGEEMYYRDVAREIYKEKGSLENIENYLYDFIKEAFKNINIEDVLEKYNFYKTIMANIDKFVLRDRYDLLRNHRYGLIDRYAVQLDLERRCVFYLDLIYYAIEFYNDEKSVMYYMGKLRELPENFVVENSDYFVYLGIKIYERYDVIWEIIKKRIYYFSGFVEIASDLMERGLFSDNIKAIDFMMNIADEENEFYIDDIIKDIIISVFNLNVEYKELWDRIYNIISKMENDITKKDVIIIIAELVRERGITDKAVWNKIISYVDTIDDNSNDEKERLFNKIDGLFNETKKEIVNIRPYKIIRDRDKMTNELKSIVVQMNEAKDKKEYEKYFVKLRDTMSWEKIFFNKLYIINIFEVIKVLDDVKIKDGVKSVVGYKFYGIVTNAFNVMKLFTNIISYPVFFKSNKDKMFAEYLETQAMVARMYRVLNKIGIRNNKDIDNLEKSLQYVHYVNSDTYKAGILEEIIDSLVFFDMDNNQINSIYEGIIKEALKIKQEETNRNKLLYKIIVLLYQHGKTEKISYLFNTIMSIDYPKQESDDIDEILNNIILSDKKWEDDYNWIREYLYRPFRNEKDSYKYDIILRILKQLEKNRRRDLYRKIIKIIDIIVIESDYFLYKVIMEFLNHLNRMGVTDMDIWNMLKKEIEKIINNEYKLYALSLWYEIQYKTHKKSRAKQFIKRALREASIVTDNTEKSVILLILSLFMYKIGWVSEGEERIKNTLEIVNKIEYDWDKHKILVDMFNSCYCLSEYIIGKSMQIIDGIHNHFCKGQTLLALSRWFYKNGNKNRSIELLNNVLNLYDNMKFEYEKYNTTKTILDIFLQMNIYDKEKTDKLIALSRKIDNNYWRSSSFYQICLYIIEIGNYNESESIIENISLPIQKNKVYKKLSYKYFVKGNYYKARRMYQRITDNRILGQLFKDILSYVMCNKNSVYRSDELGKIMEEILEKFRRRFDIIEQVIIDYDKKLMGITESRE